MVANERIKRRESVRNEKEEKRGIVRIVDARRNRIRGVRGGRNRIRGVRGGRNEEKGKGGENSPTTFWQKLTQQQ